MVAILLHKAANLPMFCPPKCLLVAMCQSFLPPKFVPYGITLKFKRNLIILKNSIHKIFWLYGIMKIHQIAFQHEPFTKNVLFKRLTTIMHVWECKKISKTQQGRYNLTNNENKDKTLQWTIPLFYHSVVQFTVHIYPSLYKVIIWMLNQKWNNTLLYMIHYGTPKCEF